MKISQQIEKNRQSGTLYQNSIDINNKNSSQTIIYDFIPPGSCVLDIGCACGDLGVALAQNKNCTLYGIEYNEKSVQIAVETHCYNHVWHCNLETLVINDFRDFFNFFDFIVFGDILEHLQEPCLAISKMLSLLKPDGECIISLPNISHGSIKAQIINNDFIYMPLGTLDETHLRFFTHKTIPTFLAQNNLVINNIKCTFMPLNGFYDYSIYDNIDEHIIRYIAKDIHSYIIQYVFLAYKDSSITREDIIKENTKFLSFGEYQDEHLNKYREEYRRKTRYLSPLHILKMPAQLVYLFTKHRKKNLFRLYDYNAIYKEIETIMKTKNWFIKNMVLYPLQLWGKFITGQFK